MDGMTKGYSTLKEDATQNASTSVKRTNPTLQCHPRDALLENLVVLPDEPSILPTIPKQRTPGVIPQIPY
jgi:hypothetical protein